MITHRLEFPAKPGPVSLDQITEADRASLRELVKNARVVVEVGTFLGGSAETMLEAMPPDSTLITIDTFRGTNGAITEKIPGDHMKRYAVERLVPRFGDRVRILCGNSLDIAREASPACADVVFIDAAHDYENCKADITAWLPVIKAGGKMAGHDFDRRATRQISREDIFERSHLEWDEELCIHPGVMRAVIESFEKIYLSEDKESTVWWTIVREK